MVVLGSGCWVLVVESLCLEEREKRKVYKMTLSLSCVATFKKKMS